MKHLFHDDIIIITEQALDVYGERSGGSEVQTKGRIVLKTGKVIDTQGETVRTDALLHIASDETIGDGDEVVFDSEYYKVMNTSRVKDAGGKVRFIKLGLQKMYKEYTSATSGIGIWVIGTDFVVS